MENRIQQHKKKDMRLLLALLIVLYPAHPLTAEELQTPLTGETTIVSSEDSEATMSVETPKELTEETQEEVALETNEEDEESALEEGDVTLFDLYLGDDLQGLVLVRFTDDWAKIEDLDGVLDQLPSISNTDQLLPLLKDKIYGERTVTDLGTIKADTSTFVLMIHPDPKFLPIGNQSKGLALSDPKNDFSLQQRFDVAASGEFGEDNDVALTHKTLASIGKFFARAEGTFQSRDDSADKYQTPLDPIEEANQIFANKYTGDNDDYNLTEAVTGTIIGEYQVGFGAQQTDGGPFAGSVDFLGAYLDTSEDLFLNRDDLHGSRLTVYIPTKSRVEFFQGNRLISAQILDFGLQEINTSSFPHGSYYVDIVIHQDNGPIIRDRQFFTKSGMLTIRSHPIVTLRVGALRNNLDVFDIPIYQASARMRALSFLELNGAVNGTDDITIGSAGFRAMYLNYNLGATLACSSKGEYGVVGDLNGTISNFHWYITHSETSADTVDETSDPALTPLSSRDQELDIFNTLADARSNTSGAIGYTLGPVQLQFRGTKNKLNGEETYAYGPDLRWNIIQTFRHMIYLNAAYLKTDHDGDEFQAALFYRYSLGNSTSGPQQSIQINATSQNDGGDGLDVVRTAYERTDRTRTGKGTKIRLQNEVHNKRGKQADSFVANEARVEYANNYLDTNAFIRDQRLSDDNRSSYGVNGSSSFIVDKSLVPQIAFPFKTDAALVVVVDSETSNEKVQILINGSLYETITAGDKTIIGLHPYREYKISIKPVEKNEFVLYDSAPRKVTLFPGNIAREEWKIDKMVIGIGRAVDVNGEPIEWKRIKGTHTYTTTEDDGFFQVEMTGDEKFYIEIKKNKCFLHLPEFSDSEFSVDLGDVVCK
ncbi:MAG: TcfC E-set like domain-containing protein [Bdellovibrionota bacterium]|jgi:hypothetical protein